MGEPQRLSWLAQIRRTPWNPVSQLSLGTFVLGCLLLLVALLTDKDGFLPVIDHANLAFHEAGHLFFGIFGRTLELYGGTLGQFVFPAVVIVYFWMRRETIAVAVGLIWFFENFRYVATYMADARARVLPLVGGGEHDWANIFRRWGALQSDTTVAAVTTTLSWAGMLAACAWIGWRLIRDQKDAE